MSDLDKAIHGLPRFEQAACVANWKSADHLKVGFSWAELRAAVLMSAILVPALGANDATRERVWQLLVDDLQAAYNRGADDAVNEL